MNVRALNRRVKPLCLEFVTYCLYGLSVNFYSLGVLGVNLSASSSSPLSPSLHGSISRARPRRAARGGGQPEPLAGGGGEPQGLLLYMRWSIGVYVLGPECVLDEQAPRGFTSFQNPSVRQVFHSFE